jgi:hypothetical protein
MPDPETILGHRLLHKVGTNNATPAFNRAVVTHKYFLTDLGHLGRLTEFCPCHQRFRVTHYSAELVFVLHTSPDFPAHSTM